MIFFIVLVCLCITNDCLCDTLVCPHDIAWVTPDQKFHLLWLGQFKSQAFVWYTLLSSDNSYSAPDK